MQAAAIVRIANTTVRDNGVYGIHLADGARGTITRAVRNNFTDTSGTITVVATK